MGPDQIKKIGISDSLEFVYLVHCYGGLLNTEWSKVFYSVKIKTSDKTSLYPIHIYWLWFKLPKIIHDEI